MGANTIPKIIHRIIYIAINFHALFFLNRSSDHMDPKITANIAKPQMAMNKTANTGDHIIL